MTKKIILVLLTAIYSFAAWNGETAKPAIQTTANGDVYQISSPAELAWFASQVNNGQTDLNAELTADIQLGSDSSSYSSSLWPIIGVDKENAYKGTFDGNNHTVYGLNVALGTPFSYGLFGYLDAEGVVRNVSVAYSHFDFDFQNMAKDSVNLGQLVGRSEGTVYNCHARKGNIRVFDENARLVDRIYRPAKGYVGGLIGIMSSGTMEKVSNSTEINLDAFGYYVVGGVVGNMGRDVVLKDAKNFADIHVKGDASSTYIGISYNLNSYVNMLGDKHENYAGGIVGINEAEAYSCENRGNIYANFGTVGGIAGKSWHLYDVVNYGTIADTLGLAGGISGHQIVGWNYVNHGNVFGYFAGGIVGYVFGSAGGHNKGSVHGTMLAGGIVAMGSVIYSKNEGKVSGKIAGGLAGYGRGNAIEYAFNLSGDIQGDSLEGILVGYLETEIKHGYYNKDLVSDMACYGGVPETSRPLWCVGMTTDSLKQREFVGRFSEDCKFRYGEREWSYVPDEYPEFRKDGFQEVFPVIFDDGQFISTGYTDYQGKLDKMKIPVSEEGHYFAGWVDGEGNPVGVDHVFTDSTVLYARYSETIEDTSLVVYSQPSDVPEFKVWNGDFQKIDKIVRKDGRLYYAIYTPAELKWYLDDSRNLSAILMNDLVLGKDSLTPTEHNLYYWYRGRTGLCDTCIFDGNHHTIYGLRHSLFDSLGANLEWYELPGGRSYAYYMSEALVKDLNIRSALVEQYAGAIAQVNLGHIRNCSVQAKPFDTTVTMGGLVYYNEGDIDSAEFIFDFNRSDSKNHDYKISGIAAYNTFGGKITNAYTHGHIDISQENNFSVIISGITYESYGDLDNVRNETSFDVSAYNVEVAGIANFTQHIINGVNTGDINVNSWGYYHRLAGIALTNEGIVDSCSNSGNIHLAYSISPGRDSVAMAGIVALNFGEGSVKNVLNEGRILMEDISKDGRYPNKFSIGGIVGSNWGYVDSTENRKPILHECPNFYNECEYSRVENKDLKFAIGGIAGKNFGELKNSKNLGRVSGFTNVGGIAGISDSVLMNVNNRGPVYGISVTYGHYAYIKTVEPYVGGIAGTCNQVEGAYNDAPIFYAYADQKLSSHIGGVCGSLKGNMNQAYNIGDIYSEDNVDSSFVAGIVADLYPGASITNAFNWGNVNSRGFSGGVWAKGDSAVVVKNVYSTAKVDGMKLQGGVYAFVADYEEDHAKNAYVYYDSAAVNDLYSVDFFAPMSSDLMKTDDFKDALNTTAGTEENSKIWTRGEGYPVFAGYDMIPMSSYYEEGFSSSSVKSSSSVSSSSSAKSSSSVESSSSAKSSSSVESSSSAKSSSSVESSSSTEEIPVAMKPANFAVNVLGRIISVRYEKESANYLLLDSQGRILKSGMLYKGVSSIEVTHSGKYILRVDGINQLVNVR
jgi:hypothetical protein